MHFPSLPVIISLPLPGTIVTSVASRIAADMVTARPVDEADLVLALLAAP